MAEAVAKVTQELRAEHNTTIAASATLLRRAESEAETKREQELMATNERLTKEAEAATKAAVEAAEAEAAARLAEVRIEVSAGRDSAIAQAAAEAAKATTARLEEEHKAHIAKLEEGHKAHNARLAERQAQFNKTFKALMKQLIDQPQSVGTPKSPTGAPLAITFDQEASG